MKNKIKPLFLILALVVLTTMLMLPVKNHAIQEMPGKLGIVGGIPGCLCPISENPECGCGIIDPSGS